MASTTSIQSTEATCRDFAAEFPTPNVLRAIALAEAGQIQWDRLADLFQRSLAKGMAAVA